MVDGKTASSDEFVPALIVPALDEIVLALGRGVVSQVSAVQPDRLELVGPWDKCLPLSDVEHVAVDGIVARRSLSVIVVVAADHQGGLGPCVVGCAVCLVVRVVEVHEAEHVAVFVAECAYGCEAERLAG